jgi:hypothetical protein
VVNRCLCEIVRCGQRETCGMISQRRFSSWWSRSYCILWCIWRKRNNRCFEDSSMTREELLHFFLVTLYSWTTGWLAPQAISFVDFLSFFSFSLVPFVYSQCTKGCAPLCFFDIIF